MWGLSAEIQGPWVGAGEMVWGGLNNPFCTPQPVHKEQNSEGKWLVPFSLVLSCVYFIFNSVCRQQGGFQKTVCWGVSLGCFSFYNATPLIPFWGLSLAKVTGIRNHWDLGWMFEDELKCQGKYLASRDKVITQKWSVLLFAALAREFHWYWSLAGKVGK